MQRLQLFVLASLLAFALPSPIAAQGFDTAPARGVLARLLPSAYAAIELGTLPADKASERFRISNHAGKVLVEGSTPSALLFGVNWYLRYVAHGQVSTNGIRIPAGPPPLPSATMEGHTRFAFRYALNQNTDGYTSPYWTWPRFEREIDILALSGVNAMIVERGMDSVLYRTFRDAGYGDAAIRQWITQPAHQNWQLMGNLCCFNGPISTGLLARRAASAKQLVDRLRELGITPVLPGFYGVVPADFQQKFPAAHVVPQGEWAGFTRPGWLDPLDPLYAKLAASFYRHQHELYGDSAVYDMEVFQEGGQAGDVPVAAAARAVQAALHKAHPSAKWMMLAWQGNPRQDLLAGVDKASLLIIDIDHDRVPRDDRMRDFQGAPFLFGGIWGFGGRTTLGTNIANLNERMQKLASENSNMVGTAIFPEGMDTNPFAFDVFAEMAWRSEPIDLPSWTRDYVVRRYGQPDKHALTAWRILLDTAYAIHLDEVAFHSERDAAQESLFNAQPNLVANRASHWSPEAMRYDAKAFRTALDALLAVAPPLRVSDTYRYDLVDVARQALANESRALLPRIKHAYDTKNRTSLATLSRRWLALMSLQDELLATNAWFMVGTWLAPVDSWASSAHERHVLEYDARSLLTTWGDRKASESADLHDYGNKDWAGLTRDYYRARWQTYFASLDASLRDGVPPKVIDWYAMGDTWNRLSTSYPVKARGDAHAVAVRVAQALATP